MSQRFLLSFLILLSSSCKESTKDLFNDAEYYSNRKDYRKAIDVYNEIIKRADTLQLAHFERGLCFQKIGEYNKAIDDYDRVVELHPPRIIDFIPNRNSPWIPEKDKYIVDPNEAIYQRARVKYLMGNLDGSFNDFQICVENNFNQYNCYLWQGTIQIRSGHKEQGCEFYQKAILFEPIEAPKLIDKYCN